MIGHGDPAPFVHLGEASLTAQADKGLVLVRREVLWPTHGVGAIVTQDEQRHRRDGIRARLRPADHAHHDLAAAGLRALERLVGQLSVHTSRHARPCERQDGLLVRAQRDRPCGALEVHRAAVQVGAQGEAP